MDLYSFCTGVLVGAIWYRLVSSVWDLGQIGLYIREVEKNALIMLATAAEAVAYIQMIKYNSMIDLKLKESTIKLTINVDNYNFDAWKNSAVSNLIAAYPPYYKNKMKYVDWDTAMDFLDKVYHKSRRKNESDK